MKLKEAINVKVTGPMTKNSKDEILKKKISYLMKKFGTYHQVAKELGIDPDLIKSIYDKDKNVKEKKIPKVPAKFKGITDNELSQLEEVAELIKNQCKKSAKFFKSKKGAVLARGSNDNDGVWYKREQRGKRKPTDSAKMVDEFIESYRALNFAEIPSRQKAVFIEPIKHSSKAERGGYGDLFIIFPVDNFKIFQSNSVQDFFESNVYISIMGALGNWNLDPAYDMNKLTSVKLKKAIDKLDLEDLEEFDQKDFSNLTELGSYIDEFTSKYMSGNSIKIKKGDMYDFDFIKSFHNFIDRNGDDLEEAFLSKSSIGSDIDIPGFDEILEFLEHILDCKRQVDDYFKSSNGTLNNVKPNLYEVLIETPRYYAVSISYKKYLYDLL